jgi:hypothetical protein
MAGATKKLTFTGRPKSIGPGGAWAYLKIPFDIEKQFGSRARVAVKGTLNGLPYRTSIFPDGKGHHNMMFNKDLQQGSGAGPGDPVRVTMQLDTAPRKVEVPADFKKALAKNARAKAGFEKLAPSYQRDYVRWIEEAKRTETRIARIERALPLLAAGKRLR